MLRLVVRGEPAPKGSMKCVGRGGRHQLVPDDKTGRLKPWVERLTAAARSGADRLQGSVAPAQQPVGVQATFYVTRPASSRRPMPSVRGADLDKLARALLDALQSGGVVVDDAQVCDLWLSKRYADAAHPEGVELRAWPIDLEG